MSWLKGVSKKEKKRENAEDELLVFSEGKVKSIPKEEVDNEGKPYTAQPLDQEMNKKKIKDIKKNNNRKLTTLIFSILFVLIIVWIVFEIKHLVTEAPPKKGEVDTVQVEINKQTVANSNTQTVDTSQPTTSQTPPTEQTAGGGTASGTVSNGLPELPAISSLAPKSDKVLNIINFVNNSNTNLLSLVQQNEQLIVSYENREINRMNLEGKLKANFATIEQFRNAFVSSESIFTNGTMELHNISIQRYENLITYADNQATLSRSFSTTFDELKNYHIEVDQKFAKQQIEVIKALLTANKIDFKFDEVTQGLTIMTK